MTATVHRLLLLACKQHGVVETARLSGIAQSTVSKWHHIPLKDRYKENHATDAAFEEALRRVVDEDELVSHETPDVGRDDGSVSQVGQEQEPTPYISGVTSRGEDDFEEVYRRAVYDFKRKASTHHKRKHQIIQFPYGPILIVFAGDQHFGNAGTDVERAFREAELIRSTPGAYAWLMGDICDNYIVGKLQAVRFASRSSVPDEWLLSRKYLETLGDKIIAVNSGNHPGWTEMLTGIDYDREITPEGPLYDTDEITATVRVGRGSVVIRARHKWKGNSIYNPTHGMERAARFDTPNVDILAGAHTHPGAMVREFNLDGKPRLAVQSSAYKFIDGYAKREGFTQNDWSTAAAVLIHDNGTFIGSRFLEEMCDMMRFYYRRAA